MGHTTDNVKSPDYNEQHAIYVGTQVGTFKRIEVYSEDKPFNTVNLQSLDNLTKDTGITSLSWTDADENEILVGRGDSVIRTFDAEKGHFREEDQKIPAGKVVGLASLNNNIIAASDNGKIHILDNGSVLEAGDNISRMRANIKNPHLIAVGGRDLQNCVKVYDLNTKEIVFKSKNVPHDNLQLEVPVWDSDIALFGDELATCSRYGYIRYYDMRAEQRRPVLNHFDEDRAFNSMAEHNGILYVSTTTGGLFAFDKKNFKIPLHTYKGATGSILSIDIDDTGKYLFTASLDRYVRVHNAEKTNMVYQCYVKSKASQILVKTGIVKEEKESDVEDEDDKEYDELFDQMQKVGDGEEEPIAKKLKLPEKQIMKRHSGLKVPIRPESS